MRASRMVVVVAAILFGAGQLPAQTDSCLRRSVPVNVLDDQGRMVTELTENNFTASIQHRPVKILSVVPDDSPRRVIIVLDASGSMTGERSLWHLYLAVARNLVRPMSSDTLAGLIVFSSRIEKNIPLTANKKDLQDELTILEPGTKALPKGPRATALWDALATAASEFGGHQEGDAIYALSDGGDNASKTTEDSLREDVLKKQIRLFILSVDANAGPSTLERVGLTSLVDLSNATGGSAVNVSRNAIGGLPALANGSGKPTTQGELLMMQFRQIFSFQKIEIQLPKILDKTQDWNLEVTGTKVKDLRVVYPHKLAGCARVL